MYDDSFFGDMSRALHTILLLFQYKPPFFKHNKLLPIVSPRFILDMVVLFKPRIYMTNDIIITEGESIIDVFFASANSYCKVYIGGQWVRDLYNGDYFGEIAIFLRSRRRTATILCYKDSDFLIIEGDKLQNLLRNLPGRLCKN
jgi:CRP-like cAMP-binding protein